MTPEKQATDCCGCGCASLAWLAFSKPDTHEECPAPSPQPGTSKEKRDAGPPEGSPTTLGVPLLAARSLMLQTNWGQSSPPHR